MIRARIVVEGDVQKVGYRDFVQKVARKLGVKGYVENLRDGSVQIVCEVEEPVLDVFVERVNVKEDLIEVEKVQVVEKSEATGEFEFFEIRYGRLVEEFDEMFGTLFEHIRAMHRDIQIMLGNSKGLTTEVEGLIG